MELSIVIVNWNSGKQLRECLASLNASAVQLPVGCTLQRVVVVDNASDDGSAQDLPALDGRLHLICNRINRGFGAGCNQGADGLCSDLILFLNPDTRLFPGSLRTAVEFLTNAAHARSGIAGIQMIDDAGRVARSCARFPRAWHFASQAIGLDRVAPRLGHYMREWDHGDTRIVDQVIGAYFMIRREVFEQLQGFDERFFVYFEEVDLALRARRAGWSSVYLAAAQAYHKGGGTSNQVKAQRLFYSLRSRLLFGRKHFALWERWLLSVITYLIEPLSRCVHLAMSLRFTEFTHVWRAYWMLLRDGLQVDSGPDIPKSPAQQPVGAEHDDRD